MDRKNSSKISKGKVALKVFSFLGNVSMYGFITHSLLTQEKDEDLATIKLELMPNEDVVKLSSKSQDVSFSINLSKKHFLKLCKENDSLTGQQTLKITQYQSVVVDYDKLEEQNFCSYLKAVN
jgi:hypothetical protein